MVTFFRLIAIAGLCLTFFVSNANDTLGTITIKVGIKETPPFIIKKGSEYSGVSIDLWEQVAGELGQSYEYRMYDLPGLLEALRKKEIDICINPLTVTSDRVREFDFTQPFYISSLAIAVRKKEQSYLVLFLRNFFTVNFLKAVFLLFVVIFIFGFLVWLVERKRNPEQFQPDLKGVGEGIWWSAVTMTTVGYGDKAPSTLAGRIIATVWMFTAVIIISSFTASIASSLTVGRLSSDIKGLEDLKSHRTGVVQASSSEAFLGTQGIATEEYSSPIDGLKALSNDELDAFVYDKPIMSYLIFNNNLNGDIQILPKTFNTQYYSFSLPKGNAMLDQLNPVLLEEISTVRWKTILSQYNLE